MSFRAAAAITGADISTYIDAPYAAMREQSHARACLPCDAAADMQKGMPRHAMPGFSRYRLFPRGKYADSAFNNTSLEAFDIYARARSEEVMYRMPRCHFTIF